MTMSHEHILIHILVIKTTHVNDPRGDTNKKIKNKRVKI
jgi:hypothetical protein